MLTSNNPWFPDALVLLNTGRFDLLIRVLASMALLDYGDRFTRRRSLRNQLFAHVKAAGTLLWYPPTRGHHVYLYQWYCWCLRQAIRQSQLISAGPSLGCDYHVTVSPLLFLIVLSMVIVMVFIIKDVSGRYFGAQQKNLGIENGFIEMMTGQKVVKAFVHSQKALKILIGSMTKLFESSYLANPLPMSSCPFLGTWEMFPLFWRHDRWTLCPQERHRWFNHWCWPHGLSAIEPFFTVRLPRSLNEVNFVLMALAGGDLFDLLDERKKLTKERSDVVSMN